MQTYSVRDVARVLRLSPGTLRGLINAGFVKPQRNSRGHYLFGFQDLILLRAARDLIEAKIPRRRITRSLGNLRRSLPESLPLTGLNICAVGDRVVVREGNAQWQADNRQYLLGFDVSSGNGKLKIVDLKRKRPETARCKAEVEDWFAEALRLEAEDPQAAIGAYERAVRSDPKNCAAWINWGRLLHERGRAPDAERVYREALRRCGPEPLLMFNLGVLLEDTGRAADALEAYQAALAKDPTLADCHYNIARLYEVLGKRQQAIRHLGQYRRLTSAR